MMEAAAGTAAAGAATGGGESADEFWATHKAWEETVLSENVKVVVRDPETTSTMFSSYVTYLCTTEPLGYFVRRRYSDFEWLRNLLQERYVGMLIPSMPDKSTSMMSGNKHHFIKVRMRSLGIFLVRLMRIPYLRSDQTVLKFLSLNNDSEWKSYKASCKPEEEKDAGEGYERWIKAINRYEMPKNAERLVNDVMRQLDSHERVQSALIKSSQRLMEKATAYAEEMKIFTQNYRSVAKTENDTGGKGKSNVENPHLEQLNKYMDTTIDCFSDWSSILEFSPNLSEMLLHEVLKYELKQVQQLRVLLKKRETMISAHSTAVNKLSKSEMRQQQAIERNKASEAAKIGNEVEVDRKHADQCKFVVDFMTKGLFFAELDRFSKEKLDNFQRMMAEFAASQLAFSKRNESMWEKFITNLDKDPEQMLADSKETMKEMEQIISDDDPFKKGE